MEQNIPESVDGMKRENKNLWESMKNGWMGFARRLAVVNTTLLLVLVYVFVIGISSLIMWILGKDLLNRKRRAMTTFWKQKEQPEDDLRRAHYQF